MTDYTPISCADCGAEIHPRDGRWLHFVPWKIEPIIFCDGCVTRIAPITHPDAPLLAPTGWGPIPPARRRRGRGAPSTPERSEP